MNVPAALAWLEQTQLHGMKLGLERMHRLLERLGRPERQLRFLHVAGTNGKGSVCAMIDAIARRHGLRSGLYTSPHLVRFHERIQIDQVPIDDHTLASGLQRIRSEVQHWEEHPTYFEIATALALLHFAEQSVDLVALETGLGGRLDATNVVQPLAALLTAIDVDHATYLGQTPALVAAEKGGIIKPHTPAFSYPQTEEVASVLRQIALRDHAPLAFVEDPYPTDRPLALPGDHQRWNAALALAGARIAIPHLDECLAAEALSTVVWPGRFQLHQPFLLDGAHNPHAARALARAWTARHGPGRPAQIVFGALGDKDVGSILQCLAPIAARFLFVPVQNPRAISLQHLLEIHRAISPETEAESFPSLQAGLDRARARWTPPDPPVLVTGSLFLVGEFLGRAAQHGNTCA